MKKLLAAVITGVVIAGVAATNVSAEEYQVQEGDSLWSIADEYSTTVDDIVDANKLDSKTIHPDQKLSIGDNETYKVKKGDTLGSIAKKFDVKVKAIKDWNDMDSDVIVIGQKLELEDVTVDKGDEESSDNAETSDNVEASEDNVKELNNNTEESDAGKQENTNQEAEETASNKESAEESEGDHAPEGETVSVSATAYTASCEGCSGVTSTGVDLGDNPDEKVIAVDPDVIPLGSEVYVEGYGHATAADTGGAINGNKIDVHVPNEGEANSWGVKDVDVTILD